MPARNCWRSSWSGSSLAIWRRKGCSAASSSAHLPAMLARNASRSPLGPRKRAAEFRRFLGTVDQQMPVSLEVHLIVDNASIHGAPTVQRWLRQHPRFHLHFVTTYSSWLNLVERWFGKLTEDALRRGNHCSTRELEGAIQKYIAESNDDPKPFVWTKTADQILASVARRCPPRRLEALRRSSEAGTLRSTWRADRQCPTCRRA